MQSGGPPTPGDAARCAVHPGRPAADICPRCGRRRCASDAATSGGGCAACAPRHLQTGPVRPHRGTQALAGTALALTATALFGGAVSGEYVGASVFDLLVPALVGLACGLVAARGARTLPSGTAAVLSAAYAVLSAAYGFHFSRTAMTSFAQAGPPLMLGGAVAAISSVWSARPATGPRGPSGRREGGRDPDHPPGG